MRIVHEWGRFIGIERDGVERLRYNYQLAGDPSPSAPKPFCHPIRTPDGIEITAREPLDHLWHRGLWFTWKFVGGVNYWEERDEIFGRQVTLAPPTIEAAEDGKAVLWRSEIDWRDARDGPETTRIRERRAIRCRLIDDGAMVLDWTSEQTAQEDLTLDRTPFTTWGGYGGLFVRMTQALQKQTVVLDDGTTTDRPLGEPYRWAAIQGQLDTGRNHHAAFVFLPSPDNQRAPEPFYGNARPFYNFFGPAPCSTSPGRSQRAKRSAWPIACSFCPAWLTRRRWMGIIATTPEAKVQGGPEDMARQHRLPSDETLHGGERGSSALRALLWTGAAVGAAAAVNALIFYKTPPLTSQLEGGEVRYFPTPEGDVFYKKAGDGPPLLLVHGIGAGCSSFEFRKIWKPLAEQHTVYALDLLGFGKSDKPALAYSDATFINLLSDFAREVMGVGDGRGEADVIASSLSAAYVIALSQRDPSLFHRLVLICPTGIEELAEPVHLGSVVLRGTLSAPVLGTSAFNLMASRTGIRRYLKTFIYASPKNVTDDVVEQYYIAAHQPGGEHVQPSFVSGYLNCDVAEAFPGVVDLPLLVWGEKAVITPVAQAEAFLKSNPNAKLEVVPDAGMLPHEEQPEAFLAAVRPFLYGAPESGEGDEEDTEGGDGGDDTGQDSGV